MMNCSRFAKSHLGWFLQERSLLRSFLWAIWRSRLNTFLLLMILTMEPMLHFTLWNSMKNVKANACSAMCDTFLQGSLATFLFFSLGEHNLLPRMSMSSALRIVMVLDYASGLKLSLSTRCLHPILSMVLGGLPLVSQ